MNTPPLGCAVRVYWRDATGNLDRWTAVADIDTTCHEVQTVGILIAQDAECLTVALSQDQVTEAVDGAITIPFGVVTAVVRL